MPVTLAGAGAPRQFIRDDAPPPVSLSDAVASANAAPIATTTSTAGTAAGIASYRIGEELTSTGPTNTVRQTSNVTATFTADLTTLTSDEARRDHAVETQALHTATDPTATCTLTRPLGLPAGLARER